MIAEAPTLLNRILQSTLGQRKYLVGAKSFLMIGNGDGSLESLSTVSSSCKMPNTVAAAIEKNVRLEKNMFSI